VGPLIFESSFAPLDSDENGSGLGRRVEAGEINVEEEVTPGTEKNGEGEGFEDGLVELPASRARRAAARSTKGAGLDWTGLGADDVGTGVGFVGFRNLSLSPLICSLRSISFSSFVFV